MKPRVLFAVATCALLALPPLAAAEAPPAAPPAPSLPWVMRPTAPGTLLRVDSVVGLHDAGQAVTTIAQGSYKLRADLAVGVRFAFNVASPDEGDGGTAFANPALFALWAPKLALPVKLTFFAAAVAPLGQGGGADADAGAAMAVGTGVQTRQGMDNALFAVNYATAIGGVGVSWVRGRLTLVAEATVLELVRARDVAGDDYRTNFTSGVHAGWRAFGPLTASAELHAQRWLHAPALLDAGPATREEQLTWTIGLRGWWKVGDVKLRPGLSYSRAIDAPMGDGGWQIVQIDVPVVF